ncbi:F1 complex, OSCP/delta subunit of ATPase [Conidiobolus coronatus NRRL 28638]|uniref:ATP synthase subunit 5, mitochondrial n=1 Tax=Conidiobolus coronatus (strain ATCC 28846 / CBS 209.66 / NRRL 28638) TaxID=796925 RepID=A0A137PDE5_CONC2|nr:F1 complex, OSCP/delta subunit of ATPase [Conidiobolus coronatus NRRL 28638]|eukprot:KXN73013.1 F1 complex, OSCP/delta subunit of ATPase [Conidiobolus coronatus NRRL 28638]
MSSITRTLAQSAPKLARSYATATQSVQVPLTLHGIHGRYATALYTAAVKKNALDQVEGDFKKFTETLTKDPKVVALLENPTLKKEARAAVVEAVFQKAKLNPLTTNLFAVLSENRRLDQATKIVESYQALMSAHRGEVVVNVTSAKTLESDLLTQLKNNLSKSSLAKDAKSVVIKNSVNPSILGGLIIEVGDKTIDLSVASKVMKLNKLLTDAI